MTAELTSGATGAGDVYAGILGATNGRHSWGSIWTPRADESVRPCKFLDGLEIKFGSVTKSRESLDGMV